MVPFVEAIVIVVVFDVIALVRGFRPSPRAIARIVDRLGSSSGLLVTHELRPTLERRARRLRRADYAGGAVGITIGLLLLQPWAGISDQVASIAAAPLWAGTWVGSAATVLVDSGSRVADAPRIARSNAVGLRDYLSWLNRWMPWIAVAAVGALIVVLAVRLPGLRLSELAPAACFVVVALIAAALFEVAASTILRRPQPAASEIALQWDDALRASSLRRLAAIPPLLAMFGLFALESFFGSNNPGPIVSINAAVILAVAVIALVMWLRGPQYYFLRRLWPAEAEIAANRPNQVPDQVAR